MSSEIVIYTTQDGKTKLQVNLQDETVWLTQDQMALLFGKAKSTINEHIKNVNDENDEKELIESETMRKFGISELSNKPTNRKLMGMADWIQKLDTSKSSNKNPGARIQHPFKSSS